MNLMKSLRNLAIAAVLLSAGAANAALYQFNLTGDYTASWQIDTSLAPDVAEDNLWFEIWDVPGPDGFFGVADIIFYNEFLGGGLEIYDPYFFGTLVATDGAQLYTGTEDSPIYKLGTFALTEFRGTGTYVLTITDLDALPGEVPEPATTALLLGGLGLLAAARRRRPTR